MKNEKSPINRKSKMTNHIKTPSLCNIPVNPNKEGDRYDSHRPEQLRVYPQNLKVQSDKQEKSF